MSRTMTKAAQILMDVGVLGLSFALAMWLRFDGEMPVSMFKRLIINAPYVVSLQYLMLSLSGVTRFSWRYIGMREIPRIFVVLGAANALLLGMRLVMGWAQQSVVFLYHGVIPLGVIAMNFILAFSGVVGLRVLRRIVTEKGEREVQQRVHGVGAEQVSTVLIGAGAAGVMIARELEQHGARLGIKVEGFIDDDLRKEGSVIYGLPVFGSMKMLPEICERHQVKQAIITISSVSGKVIREIAGSCRGLGIKVKVIPGIHELIAGKVGLSQVRDVSVEDLLGREPVVLETGLVEEFLKGKCVMVTGAGGSIGSEICRQVLRFEPKVLLLVERSEYHLFMIQQELKKVKGVEVVSLMCDVGDKERIEGVFERYRPHVVFHAAAHKHVPLMESNPLEAVKNNVFGTRAVADAADRYGAAHFVMISTDKAVNPTSVMGATKRVAELYIQALSRRSKTQYVAVRFGNVLGSAGSVIPIFKAQIAAGGPVMVTHPEMKRYFMTIPEASQLVLQAGAMGRGGDIFVLDMGEPVKIIDLAKDVIRLSGYEPETDIAIEFSGVRPGEKLFEELGFDGERMEKTRHPKIFIGKLVAPDWEDVNHWIGRLQGLEEGAGVEVVRGMLMEVVPEMQRDARQEEVKNEGERGFSVKRVSDQRGEVVV
jgi:FlaA1/EpsC-like NDP-sugar epimerase